MFHGRVKMKIKPVNITSTVIELSRIMESAVTAPSSAQAGRAFDALVERNSLPGIWWSAERAFGELEEFPGRIFTNGNSVSHGSAQRADTLVFAIFVCPEEITIDVLAGAVYREAGCGLLSHPTVSSIDRAVILEGTYISEGISLHALTRYHLDNDRRTISQITVTTASRSEVDPVTRGWLIALDTPNDEVPGS